MDKHSSSKALLSARKHIASDEDFLEHAPWSADSQLAKGKSGADSRVKVARLARAVLCCRHVDLGEVGIDINITVVKPHSPKASGESVELSESESD